MGFWQGCELNPSLPKKKKVSENPPPLPPPPPLPSTHHHTSRGEGRFKSQPCIYRKWCLLLWARSKQFPLFSRTVSFLLRESSVRSRRNLLVKTIYSVFFFAKARAGFFKICCHRSWHGFFWTAELQNFPSFLNPRRLVQLAVHPEDAANHIFMLLFSLSLLWFFLASPGLKWLSILSSSIFKKHFLS